MTLPARSASDTLRLNDEEGRSLGGVVGDDGEVSLLLVPTYSADSLREPAASTLLTGLMVSTPEPRSASRMIVPAPVILCLAAYEDLIAERMEPVYAGGEPKGVSSSTG